MTREEKWKLADDLLGLLRLAGLGATLFIIGVLHGFRIERDEAEKAGVGRWEADPATGAKRFVYGAPGQGE